MEASMRDFQRGLTADRLRELLVYDHLEGTFPYRIARGSKSAGKLAGTLGPGHYIIICIDYRLYVAHRLARLYMTGEWPREQIDHAKLGRYDNRWENLREATRSENHANKPIGLANTSGVKGVCWNVARGKWQANICVNGVTQHLELFYVKAEAQDAYARASVAHFGEFARVA
jgi:hypothetical protein